MPDYNEKGTSGIKAYSGYVEEAYQKELRWPSCYPLYNRIRRSDPEVSVVRNIFTSLARGLSVEWDLPDNANDAEQAAKEFAESAINDLDGGASGLLEQIVSYVPFYGWGWWELVPGLRSQSWKAPGGDDWRSQYDDNLIGFRRAAFRDHSSFYKWELDDKTGKLAGMWQQDYPNEPVLLEVGRALHLTYGDTHNPEGLAALEAIWRLERIKYGLEIVQGIGFEHAAGYLSVTVEHELDQDKDSANIRKAARAIMTAQEGNYAVWPKGVNGEVKDVSFAAAPAILEAIKYFGILKLTILGMQWVALSATTGAGSYAGMSDSSAMAVLIFNAMMDGFSEQLDKQIGRRLFEMNPGAFPGMMNRPKLRITHVEKDIDLQSLGQFATVLNSLSKLSDDDLAAIRKQSGFMPEAVESEEPDQPEEETPDEQPVEEAVTDEEVAEELLAWKSWARENDPKTLALKERGFAR